MTARLSINAGMRWGLQWAAVAILTASCRGPVADQITDVRPGTANVYSYTYLCELGTPGYSDYCDDPSSSGDGGTPYEAYWGCPSNMAQWQCDFLQAAMNRLKASGISYCVNSAAAVQRLWDVNTVRYQPIRTYRDPSDSATEIGAQTFSTTFYSWTGDPSNRHVDSVRVDSIVYYDGTFKSGQSQTTMGRSIDMTAHEGAHALDPLTNTDNAGLHGGAVAVGHDCQSAIDNTPPVTGGGGGGGDALRRSKILMNMRGRLQ